MRDGERVRTSRRVQSFVRDVAAAVLIGVLAVTSVASVGAAPGYDWPLDPRPPVARQFDNPSQRWESGHRGVDLTGAAGQPVLAAGAGRVNFVGRVNDRVVVSVLHPNGFLTTYEPISEPTVQQGHQVSLGTPLGQLAAGHVGCPSNACLHWGLRRGAGREARYFNPLLLLGLAPTRLLPD